MAEALDVMWAHFIGAILLSKTRQTLAFGGLGGEGNTFATSP